MIERKIAYNWTYSSRGYAEQNCLSFALNKGNVWTRPWGTSNPTKSQAKTYLTNQGYNHFLNANEQGPLPNTPVHAYILNGRITHFSKNVSGAPVRAKWGKCEIFNHSNVDPYTNYVYGPLSFSSSK